MRNILLRAIVIGYVLVLTGCAVATVGMTQQDLLSAEGRPGEKWVGAGGIECWRYGVRHVILQNDRVIKIAMRDRRFNSASLVIGMPEEAVLSLEGPPLSVSATKDVKYLVYLNKTRKFRSKKFYIRIINGAVESYGDEDIIDPPKPE